mgnify:CR=1 FL=1|tara:strand:- start:15717 stop:16109 length:393 start_codon:yes stop_codon:yes gene_type:complete
MGTRSLTHILENKDTLTTMYRQYDGYLSGHGKELAEFLKEIQIVNGYSSDTNNIANGMGCLTAQLIAHFKDGCGNIYIYPPNTKDCWEEFTYFVYLKDKSLKIKVKNNINNHILFDGTPTELLAEIKTNE